MSGLTRLQKLNDTGITDVAETLGHLEDDEGRGFGTILYSLGAPGPQVFTGLTSSASQVAPYPGYVLGISTGGVNKTLIYAGAAGAGQVLVAYDATTGIPTFTFGDGAVTAYNLWQIAMPVGLKAALDFAP